MNIVTEPSVNPHGNTPPGNEGNDTPRSGQLIGERYRLEQPLERGAMGSIWRAEHVRLKAPVAVKFLDASLIADTEMRDRFTQEARSAAAVRSAHVVQVLDYGTEGGVPYIAMELLEGENLDTRLNRCGKLTPDELCKIFSEVARGIGKAHAMGVVHRDLKPGNLFIAREGEHEVTKIVDFGIAKVKADAIKLSQIVGTLLGTLLGTPQYMSPEQLRGSDSVDYRTDLWALAIIACECLTGRYPFTGTSIGDLTVQICTEKPLAPSSLGPVPPGFDQWFFKATRKVPSKRFESAEQMARALSKLLATSESSIPLVVGVKRGQLLPTKTRVQRARAQIAEQLEVARHRLRHAGAWLAEHATAVSRQLRWKLPELFEALRLPRLSRPVSFAALGLLVLCGAVLMRVMDERPTRAATPESEPAIATASLAPARHDRAPSDVPAPDPVNQVVLAALPAAAADAPPPDESAQSGEQPAPAAALKPPPRPARAARKAAPRERAEGRERAEDPVAEAAARILKPPEDPAPVQERTNSPPSEPAAPPAPTKPAVRSPARPAAPAERHPFDDRL